MLAWLDKPFIRFASFFLAGLLAFAISVIVGFPDDQIREIATVQAEKALGPKYKVRIDELDFWWFPGLSLKGVQIEERKVEEIPEDPDVPVDLPMKVRIERVSARLAPLSSLMNLAPTVSFEIDVQGGTINGTVAIGKEIAIDADFSELDLRATPSIAAFTGMPFFGTLSGEVQWTLDSKMQPKGGYLKFSGSQLTIGPATIMTDKFPPMTYFEIPQTNFGTLAIDMAMSGDGKSNKLQINKLESSGRDIRLEAWGDIAASGRAARSRPDVKLRLQLDDQFVKKNNIAPLLNVNEFRKGKARDWYGFTLGGTFDRIQFKGSAASAAGPSKAPAPKKAAEPN